MWQRIKNNIFIYVIAIAIPLAVGLLSAFLTRGSMDIYSEIITPALAPPAILFPIVWTVLYVLMGISSAMVYIYRDANITAARRGLSYYALSLAFNFGWSIIFFRLRAFLFAFVWLLVLLYTVIRTVMYYKKVFPLAAYLQIPYAVWVGFAGYLNIAIWYLNV